MGGRGYVPVSQRSGGIKGDKLNISRLTHAYAQYLYEPAYRSLKSQYERRHNSVDESTLKSRAMAEAKEEAQNLERRIRILEFMSPIGLTVTEKGGLPNHYRDLPDNSDHNVKVKYSGIARTDNQNYQKMPLYNPNSRENKAYVKKYGNRPFEIGIELPKEVISNYYDRNRSRKRK